MDMLDLAVSTPVPVGRAAPCLPQAGPGSRAPSQSGICSPLLSGGVVVSGASCGCGKRAQTGAVPSPQLPLLPLIGIKGSELLLSELSTGCGERKPGGH